MDKLTAIKIKYQNGTYSEQIPIGALAQNVEWDDQYGLMDIIGNVDMSADGSIQTQIDNILAEKGAVNGIAELDSTGKVPSSQLPSYVDDVLEYDSYNQFPAIGESEKIYVDKTTNLTYRWSGSGYVEISKSLALGETSSTAYRGDRGKVAYDHATDSNRLTTATNSGFYKVASTSEGHVAGLTAVQKSDITNLGVPGSDTKNTAGSTDTSSKIFLIGATSQAANPQTYSHDTAYVGTDGQLYSGGNKVLTQHQTIKQDGVSGATANRFGVCSTGAATAAKTVSITSGTFNLESGAQVSVKFSNTNSANNPTLNVNGTGAKNIFVNSSQITTGSEKLLLKGTVSFVYDGTQWHLIGGGSDSPPVVELTQAQYDALSEAEKSMNVVYMITDGTTNSIVAEDIVYDNTQSGLNATNVQTAIDLFSSMFLNNAGFHNSIYRGKNLGSSVTNTQYAAIQAGTFKDLFIGDYWVIGGVNWRIAAFDYWLNMGDTACSKHHIVIVPDSSLTTGKMNSTNITTGAYVSSDFYTGANSNTGKATARTAINNAFGSAHILTHREFLKNAVTNGYESAGAWYDSTFELMTEQMVCGCNVFGNVINGTNIPMSYTIDNAQLPLFALDHSKICNRDGWWLRDVVSPTTFAFVVYGGYCNYSSASTTYGIRPAFGICA